MCMLRPSLLAEAGIVPLVWGPKGEGLLSKKEWVNIDSFGKVVEGLRNVINRFCR
jgi:di/tripeptidase